MSIRKESFQNRASQLWIKVRNILPGELIFLPAKLNSQHTEMQHICCPLLKQRKRLGPSAFGTKQQQPNLILWYNLGHSHSPFVNESKHDGTHYQTVRMFVKDHQAPRGSFYTDVCLMLVAEPERITAERNGWLT